MNQTAELLRIAIEAAPTGMLIIDDGGLITLANAQAERLFGYSREELIGTSIDGLLPERFREEHKGYREKYLQAPTPRAMGVGRELFGMRKDGTEVPIEIGLTPLGAADGQLVLSSIVDITERKRSEETLRRALDAAPAGMLMVNEHGAIVLVNAQIEKLFGYSREELVGTPVERLIPTRFHEHHPGFRQSFFAAPQTRAMGAGRDLFGRRKDGTELPIEIGLNPLLTSAGRFVLSSIIDITERKRTVEQLTASLQERDVLLQEVHHRVKNNLQLICSLVNVQARKLEAVAARDVLNECKRRIEAIALIHEQLYQSRDYAQVPFYRYAKSLAANILHAAAPSGAIDLQCAFDPVSLPVDKAISSALILNELITNALKHAFCDGQPGRLRIELRQSGSRVTLSVSDSGHTAALRIGEPTTGIGVQIIRTLASQLDASLQTTSHDGTTVTIEFHSPSAPPSGLPLADTTAPPPRPLT